MWVWVDHIRIRVDPNVGIDPWNASDLQWTNQETRNRSRRGIQTCSKPLSPIKFSVRFREVKQVRSIQADIRLSAPPSRIQLPVTLMREIKLFFCEEERNMVQCVRSRIAYRIRMVLSSMLCLKLCIPNLDCRRQQDGTSFAQDIVTQVNTLECTVAALVVEPVAGTHSSTEHFYILNGNCEEGKTKTKHA